MFTHNLTGESLIYSQSYAVPEENSTVSSRKIPHKQFSKNTTGDSTMKSFAKPEHFGPESFVWNATQPVKNRGIEVVDQLVHDYEELVYLGEMINIEPKIRSQSTHVNKTTSIQDSLFAPPQMPSSNDRKSEEDEIEVARRDSPAPMTPTQRFEANREHYEAKVKAYMEKQNRINGWVNQNNNTKYTNEETMEDENKENKKKVKSRTERIPTRLTDDALPSLGSLKHQYKQSMLEELEAFTLRQYLEDKERAHFARLYSHNSAPVTRRSAEEERETYGRGYGRPTSVPEMRRSPQDSGYGSGYQVRPTFSASQLNAWKHKSSKELEQELQRNRKTLRSQRDLPSTFQRHLN